VTEHAQVGRIELKRTAVEQMEAVGTPKRSIWPI
jgi:hypothetical protein